MLFSPIRSLFRAAAVAALIMAAPAAGSEKTDALIDALALTDVVDVMGEEGIAYGRDLEAQMFPGKGGESWQAAVRGIYAADRILPAFNAQFAQALEAGGGDMDAMLAFARSDVGRKAVTLEVSARRALLDDAVEEAARVRLDELRIADDPRLARIGDFIAAGDLIEANVAGGLNASLAFYRGLAAAGGFDQPMPEDEMLSEVWAQEPSLRTDTEEWLFSFLVLAYAPLTDSELQAYTDFSTSKPGRDLNKALFAAFDSIFVDVSGRLGRAAAQYVAGQNL